MKIAKVGVGPVGLTTAILLKQKRMNATLFERHDGPFQLSG
jgi:2-polyprenyl-6-methoxyphenol hydroxylase-like FAD-dependent oxidoreductase